MLFPNKAWRQDYNAIKQIIIDDGDFISKEEKGAPDGVATLGTNGKVPLSQLPDDIGGGNVESVNGQEGVVVLDAMDVGAIPSSEKGRANGVAPLDSSLKVPMDNLPDMAAGRKLKVADEAARLGLSVYPDLTLAYQMDTGEGWALNANDDPAVESNWSSIGSATALGVNSFNGRTGNVNPETGDYTAEQVGAIPVEQIGVAGGVATLDENRKIPASQLPEISAGIDEAPADNNKYTRLNRQWVAETVTVVMDVALTAPSIADENGTWTVNISAASRLTDVSITSFSVRWSDGTIVNITANNNSAVATKTVTESVGAIISATVTAYDSLGNHSKETVVEATVLEFMINQPSITTPTNGSEGVTFPVVLSSSAFGTTPVGIDIHAATNWRIKDGLGNVVWQSTDNVTDKTSITVPDTAMNALSTYTAEVQYVGEEMGPSTWSNGVSFTTAKKPFSKFLVAGGADINIYERDVDSFIHVVGQPEGSTRRSLSYRSPMSKDGTFLAAAGGPGLSRVYRRVGNRFISVTPPSTVSQETTTSASFSPTGNMLVMSSGNSGTDGLIKYDIVNGEFQSAVNLTTTMGVSYCANTVFSPDGKYLAVCGKNDDDTRAIIFSVDGTSLTKLPSLPSAPSGGNVQRGVAISPDSVYFVFVGNTAPYISIYKRNGNSFTKLNNPSVVPAGACNGVSFSGDGNYLAVAHANSPFITIYSRNGDTFTKIANPTTLPTTAAQSCDFSENGLYLVVGESSPAYVSIYKRNGNSYVKLPNPNYIPTSPPATTAVYLHPSDIYGAS